jgi:alanine-glyoxylate transaminase/serine-glyoxylate transaminase/serine-pyruvate transaminase
VITYPASGTGAWEAALVNTLSPGDAVLMVRTGWFATMWQEMAQRLGLVPIMLETDWRRGAEDQDHARRIRAVCVVHNETSTGCVTPVAAGALGNRRCKPPGAAYGGRYFVVGLDRLPP